MEEYANYTKDDLNDIFEIVNSEHLKLKGREKIIAKRQFNSVWKRDNKGLGCFDLFMKLYESYDRVEKEMNWWKEYAPFPAQYYREKKAVSNARYAKRIRYCETEIEELEKKLEDVESGKGYISEQDHETRLQEAIDNEKQIIREQSDTIAKLRNKENFLRDKLEHNEGRLDKQRKYYEDQIDKLTSTKSKPKD